MMMFRCLRISSPQLCKCCWSPRSAGASTGATANLEEGNWKQKKSRARLSPKGCVPIPLVAELNGTQRGCVLTHCLQTKFQGFLLELLFSKSRAETVRKELIELPDERTTQRQGIHCRKHILGFAYRAQSSMRFLSLRHGETDVQCELDRTFNLRGNPFR